MEILKFYIQRLHRLQKADKANYKETWKIRLEKETKSWCSSQTHSYRQKESKGRNWKHQTQQNGFQTNYYNYWSIQNGWVHSKHST